MLQKEFEERIGRSVTEAEHIEANAMYMSAGDIDKDVFCREWKKMCMSPLVQGLFNTAYQNGKKVEELEQLHKENMEIVSNAADAMLEIEHGLLDGETAEHTSRAVGLLERKAMWLVGAKEVVLRKIKMGMPLGEKDMTYIAEHLK